MKNTLESSKFFPIIAWVLIIGFAVFTYFLTVNLQNNLGTLSTNVDRLEAKIDTVGDKQDIKSNTSTEKNLE